MDELQAQRNVTTANSAKHLLLALSTSRCWAGCLLPEPLGYSPWHIPLPPSLTCVALTLFLPIPPSVLISFRFASRPLAISGVSRCSVHLSRWCVRVTNPQPSLSLSVRRKNSATRETGAPARGFTQTLATICWVNSIFGELVPPTMVSRCAREDGDGRGWVEEGRKTGGYV